MNTQFQNQLTVAVSASFNKGQEVANESSTEAKEKRRQARDLIVKMQQALKANQKTQESSKGFLA